jgi:2-polyprenyl-6-hydroxyphenyl methylase/3-demethylubiquinone-9 3-methyltransferase
LRLPLLIKQIRGKWAERGMSYMTDVKDWLGGWPMEYADDQEVVDFLEERHGFQLARIATGDACTQFLFHNAGAPGRKTVVRDLARRPGARAAPRQLS